MPAQPNAEVEILRGAPLSLRAYAFALYRRTLEPHIAAAFGWDEREQRARFARSYPDDGLYRIRRGGVPVGILSLRQGEEMHVSLLLIHPRWHRHGIGRAVMLVVAQRATELNAPVTLSVFRTNAPAIALYTALGYTVCGGDEVFVEMRWQPPSCLPVDAPSQE